MGQFKYWGTSISWVGKLHLAGQIKQTLMKHGYTKSWLLSLYGGVHEQVNQDAMDHRAKDMIFHRKSLASLHSCMYFL
jgi:hypothetical protein